MEELQEADVLWPWTETPPPSPEEEEEDYLPDPELSEYDATVVDFSCEPFSEPPASSSSSLTTSALLSDWSSSDGFFLSGPSSTVSAGLELDSTEEFQEADVLWPDEDDSVEDNAAAEFCWRCCRRGEDAAAAAVTSCGKREGWRPLMSSPIDIPMVTTRVASSRRGPSPLSAVPVHHRR